MTDWCTEEGANQLADRLRRYWAAKGAQASIWVEPIAMDNYVRFKMQHRENAAGWFQVRSNIEFSVRE